MSVNQNFYELFAQHVREDESAPCIETETGEVLDRAWLNCLSARYANCLKDLDCTIGDRVAVQVDKSPHALALYLACIRAGLCFLPLNTAYQSAELSHLLVDAAPKIFVCRHSVIGLMKALGDETGVAHVLSLDESGGGTLGAEAARCAGSFETVHRDGEDTAALLYTSGTTGRPKGAIISHRAMTYCATTLGEAWRFTSTDVLLHALPIFHGHGLFISSNVALSVGCKLIFHPKFDAAAVIEALPRATVFMAVPTFYYRLLADERLDAKLCSHMRLFTSGSAPLPAILHQEFASRTGHRVLERYGTTETMILCANPIDGERRPGSVGKPLPGVELRIVDKSDAALPDGEIGIIEVRGAGLFSGYWNMPEQTKQEFSSDGFFRTGDLGWIDKERYVSITGRSKDLIISGGYNVYPAEVETVLNAHAGVRESAVIGVPHPDFGEAVVALVIASNPVQPPAPADIVQWAKTRLANFKVPKQVVVVAELPRNVMGKVQKNQLRDSYSGAFASNSGGKAAAHEAPSTLLLAT
jgi:malonyl-CoA/methylmalonyl-CoA synthetase